MWDINLKYLQANETIVYIDRPSLLSLNFILSCIWVVLMGVTSIGILSVSMSDVDGNDMGGIRLFVFIYLFFALPAIYVIIGRLSTRYVITDRSLLKRTGIVTTNIKTLPFKHITSIEVKETIIGKIFRYANLLIDTSGSGVGVEFRWKYVKAAHKVKKLIEKYVGGEK